MKKTFLPLLFLISFSMFAQLEVRYANSTDENPRWIQLMYSDTPDLGKVTEAYTKYYQTNPFVKNKHTQYYNCLLYTSPSPRDRQKSRMPSSA